MPSLASPVRTVRRRSCSDTRALRPLGDLIDVGEERGELLVIEGALARSFGAPRAKEQLNRGGFDNRVQ
jgi:hypothetical protein